MNTNELDSIMSKKDSEKYDEAIIDAYKSLDSLKLILDIKIKKLIVQSFLGDSHIGELEANLNKKLCTEFKKVSHDIEVEYKRIKRKKD